MGTPEEAFLNTVAASTIKTLQDLCQMPTKAGTPFTKGEKPQQNFAIGGVIGVTSSVANGSIMLAFPPAVFMALMSKMLGEPVTEIRQENEDAAAELLNIIFGQAKVILNKRDYAVQMAIPSILRGGEVASSYSKLHSVKVIPFTTEAGEFYVEFLLNPVKPSQEQGPKASANAVRTAAEKAAFFKPFMDGTMNTFKIQCSLEIKPGKPFSRKSSGDYHFDIAGIVGITSKTVSASFMLSFRKEVFLKLVSRMFGETITDFQPGLEDAVSEVVNIILGSAKVVLNSQGHGLEMAIPTVVQGREIVASHQRDRTGVVVPFSSDIGQFHVEIMLNEGQPAS